jgi:tetratricopeptide (TPR) repeat protein
MSRLDISGLIALLDSGKTVDALQLASELVREMPMLVTGHVVRARALESNGEFDEALLAWRNALDLVPNSPIILKGLRRTAEKLVAPPPGTDELAEPDFVDYESPELDAGHDEAGPGMFEDLSAESPVEHESVETITTADLPGFGSVDSMFDVEPEFEQRVADDLRRETGDAPDDLTTDAPPEPEADELDLLIAGLSDARIRPSDVSYPAPDLESRIEDIASETLARIYADQHQFEEAARVYQRLAETRPEDRERFLERAAVMIERAGRL